MAFKKIKPEIYNCCPKCEGKTGIEFHQKEQIKFTRAWGKALEGYDIDNLPIPNLNNKTVVCSDCKQRFTLIKKDT